MQHNATSSIEAGQMSLDFRLIQKIKIDEIQADTIIKLFYTSDPSG